jgi:hypothetical protein
MAMPDIFLLPLPIGERWLGAAESVRGILWAAAALPHPALRATFSPMGRRQDMETTHGNA